MFESNVKGPSSFFKIPLFYLFIFFCKIHLKIILTRYGYNKFTNMLVIHNKTYGSLQAESLYLKTSANYNIKGSFYGTARF